MNGRGANPVYHGHVARFPAHRRDARGFPLVVTRGTQERITSANKHDEALIRLQSEVQALKKKLEFLQKVDLAALGDEASRGDVTFVVQKDTVIKAHRFILASKSSIFKRMFDINMREKRSGEIYIEDVTGPILRATIEYLYTAVIKFTDEATAPEVFKVAHQYDIPELQAECEAELYESVTEDNLSEMLRISHLYGMERLKEKSVKLFKENFDRVQSKVINDLLYM